MGGGIPASQAAALAQVFPSQRLVPRRVGIYSGRLPSLCAILLQAGDPSALSWMPMPQQSVSFSTFVSGILSFLVYNLLTFWSAGRPEAATRQCLGVPAERRQSGSR